jgi:phosphoribosyl-ATP pyrophosphohydrolase
MDYQKSRKIKSQHPVLEELMLSCRELDSGITECEVYTRFGNRIKLQKYRKLGALLSQNLKKGSRDILQKLEVEAKEVFEDRKRSARKQGEEASTKLLFPMMIMLAAVMIMIMAPAFLTL